MFLLPSILVGLVFAALLGGKPSRILTVRLRAGRLVAVAITIQILLFSRLGASIPGTAARSLHLASYALLLVFAVANRRVRPLLAVSVGMALNALAISSNGGRMPLSRGAATAAGLAPTGHSNVSAGARQLQFLGDVFALPRGLPLANAFSIGDVLIGFGMVAFIVTASLDDRTPRRREPLVAKFSPLGIPAYRRLIGGKLISTVGDWLTLAALVGWIYKTTDSTAAVALVLIARLGPPILGSSVAALIADRLPKQRLLVAVELLRALTIAGALAGVLSSQRAIVLAALACSGALAAVSAATTPALMPSLLPSEKLPMGNAGLGIVKNVAMALGASGAGVALSSVGAPAALIGDLVTFAVAAALFAAIRVPTAPADQVERRRPRESLRYVRRERTIVLLIVAFGAATFATGLTNTILPRFFEHDLGSGAGGYAFAVACLAGGLALGEAAVGFTRVGSSAGHWIGGGLLLTSGLFGLLALERQAAAAYLFIALIGFVDGTTDILFDLAVQRHARPSHFGAVFGFASAFMSTTMVLAFALAPLANSVLTTPVTLLVAGGFFFGGGAIALAAMRDPRARAQPAPYAEA